MGYFLLALSAVSYAVGIVAQTVAARRAERRDGVDPGMLGRLVTDRVYLFGFGAQVLGFVLAFVARAELPLFLVQAGAMSAVGIAAVLGAVLLGWPIRTAEIGALTLTAVGLVLLVGAAKPGPALDLSLGVGLGLIGLLIVVMVAAVPLSRLTGPRGAIALGLLAGLAFAVLAIASRPLASAPLQELPLHPLAWLMVASAVIGQALLAVALQRGSTTATMASMDSTNVLLSSVVGLAVLGDLVAAGREPWLAAGLALVVAGVLLMAVVVRPDPAVPDLVPLDAEEPPAALEPQPVGEEA